MVVREIARTIAARPQLSILTCALPSVLEQNLGVDAIREFKMLSLVILGEVADFLVLRAPELTRNVAFQLLSDLITLIVGLYPLTHPAEAAEQAMSTPELAGMKRDYRSELERLLGAIAKDLLARSKGK